MSRREPIVAERSRDGPVLSPAMRPEQGRPPSPRPRLLSVSLPLQVIPRKDLPRIYTMYLPPSALKGGASARATAMAAGGAAASSLSHALAELSTTRDEVLRAVQAAPERRVDNLITRTHDAAAMLRMHAVVLEEARSQYVHLRRLYAAVCASFLAAAPLASYAALGPLGDAALVQLSTPTVAALAGATCVGAAALSALRGASALRTAHGRLASDAGLDALFERLHAVEVSVGDEYVRAMWGRVRPQLRSAIGSLSLAELEGLSATEHSALDDILQAQVPELRRLTSSHARPVDELQPPPAAPTAAPKAAGASAPPAL